MRKKTGGRQKGTPNKITSEIRDKIQVLISGTMDSIDISTFTKMEKIKLNMKFLILMDRVLLFLCII